MPLPAETRAPHRTKQEFVYRTIRSAILRCELRPGERLVIEDLAQRLDVSTIPVREALQLLQSEGLVESVPHVGTTVTPPSTRVDLDVFTIMEGLRLSPAGGGGAATPADSENLDRLIREMDAVVESSRLEVWGDLNTQFHVAIASIAGLPMLLQMTVGGFRLLESDAPLLLQQRAGRPRPPGSARAPRHRRGHAHADARSAGRARGASTTTTPSATTFIISTAGPPRGRA